VRFIDEFRNKEIGSGADPKDLLEVSTRPSN